MLSNASARHADEPFPQPAGYLSDFGERAARCQPGYRLRYDEFHPLVLVPTCR